MAYTGNPSTDTNDAIRLLIGDTSTSTGSEIFSDAEIEWFSAQKANVYLAASAAVISTVGTSKGNSLAQVIEKKVGDLQIKYGTESVSTTLKNKARELRAQGVRGVKPYVGGISDSDKDAQESDTDWNQPSFKVGSMDYLGGRSSST